MAKYIMIYKGAATPMGEMTEEQGKAVMAKWKTWMDGVGKALVDVGAPFGASTSMVDNGQERKAAGLEGYSIVEAADLNAAKAMTKGHPFLSEGKGNFSVEVFELTPVPF